MSRLPVSLRDRVDWADVAWWLSVLVVIGLFRLAYLVSGHVPQGLFFEEHEAAYGGRLFLQGGIDGLPQIVNYTAIALAYRFLGISDVSLRVAATTMGALGALLFALAAWRLFSRPVALVCAVAYATGYNLVMGSTSIEESFALVLFVQSALILALILYTQRPTPARGIFLGLASAAPMTEYIALKPGIVIVPVVALVCSAWSAMRAQTRADGRDLRRQWWLSALYFAAAFLLYATPAIFEIRSGGGQFFEGRTEHFVGSRSTEAFAARWPTFRRSLEAHIRTVFMRGQGGGINPDALPLLTPQVSLFTAAALALLALYWVRWSARLLGRGMWRPISRLTDDQARGARIVLWTGWATLAVSFCAFWNPSVLESRLFVVLPLLILLAGELLDAIRPFLGDRAGDAALVALAAMIVALNGRAYLSVQGSVALRKAYRSKTIELCRQLDQRDPANGYVLYWDWATGLYFGDTPFEQWVTDQTTNGYDSWPCQVQHRITVEPRLLAEPHRLVQLDVDGSSYSHVILGTRFKDDAELLQFADTDMLDSRLNEYIDRLAPRVDPDSCETFSDSIWFRYAVCDVRRPAGSASAPR